MGVKKIAFLVLIFVIWDHSSWALRYKELPLLVDGSPLFSSYSYHLKQIESRIKRLSLENGWWLSLSGTYYFNNSYAKDVIGYTFGLSLKLNKDFGGYNSNNLFQRFLARLDFLKVGLAKDERKVLLLWRLRFLFIEYLLLEQKIQILKNLEQEIETILSPLRERMIHGLEKREDVDFYVDRLFRYRLEENLCRQQQKKIEELFSLILNCEDCRPEKENLYLTLPLNLPSPEKTDFLEKVSEQLAELSKRRFYPRFKFSLGVDRTWDDNSGSLWTGFSVSVPLHFQASERARQEEIFALWQRLKAEEELRETRLKNQAFEHLMGLISYQSDLRFLARRFSSALLEKPPPVFDRSWARSRIKALEILKDYYDVQIRIFALWASLGGALQLKDFPVSHDRGLWVALPPRDLAAWWWASEPSVSHVRQVSDSLGLTRLYFSLNAKQIEEYLQKGNPELSRFIVDLYQQGTVTEILLGEPTWIFPQARKKLFQIVSWLEKRLYPLVQVVHLDLEPHALSDFSRNKERYLRLYLDTLAELRKETPMDLIVDVPLYFFREKISWQGKEALLIDHLVPLVNGVVVMNYFGDPDLFERWAKKVAQMLEARSLPYWIGLSLEKDIPSEESLKDLSVEVFRQFLREELSQISPSYFFRGLAVQNFKELEKYAAPSQTP